MKEDNASSKMSNTPSLSLCLYPQSGSGRVFVVGAVNAVNSSVYAVKNAIPSHIGEVRFHNTPGRDPF